MNSRSEPKPDRVGGRITPAFWVQLAIVGVTLGIYGQTLDFDFINFDDPLYVTENARVRSGLSWSNVRWAFTSLETGNWHPLTWLSLMLDAQVYGVANAGGFHLTNLLLHLLASVLLFGWLRELSRATADSGQTWPELWPAALIALLFAAHPLHVESVAWVTERKDVLAAAALFATLWSWTRYARAAGGAGVSHRWFYFALSLVCFALGLMAKSMIVTLPALLLLFDVWPLRRWPVLMDGKGAASFSLRSTGKLFAEKLPFVALALAAGVLTMLAARHGSALLPFPWGRRLMGAAATAIIYLGRTLWPVNLSPCYDYPLVSWSDPQLALATAALGALSGLAIWQRRRRPYLLVGWLWYLVVLLPVSGIVPVGNQPIPDRYTYLPHVGLFLMLAGAAIELARASPRWRLPLAVSGVGCVAVCAIASWRQAGYWRDGVTLFERALAVNPSTNRGARVRAGQLLGDALIAAGRPADAEARYTEALALFPGDPTSLGKLGFLRVRAGRWQEGADFLERALAVEPDDVPALNSLGLAYHKLGQTARARDAFVRCLDRRPEYPPAHFHLAAILQSEGDTAGAIQHYESALAGRPDWPAALTALALLDAASGEKGRMERARLMAERAVELTERRDAVGFDVLGAAQAALGRWDEAILAAQTALELGGRDSDSEVNEARRDRLEHYRRQQR